jgi:hypothetical protein
VTSALQGGDHPHPDCRHVFVMTSSSSLRMTGHLDTIAKLAVEDFLDKYEAIAGSGRAQIRHRGAAS